MTAELLMKSMPAYRTSMVNDNTGRNNGSFTDRDVAGDVDTRMNNCQNSKTIPLEYSDHIYFSRTEAKIKGNMFNPFSLP